jgi:hypothetical protein
MKRCSSISIFSSLVIWIPVSLVAASVCSIPMPDECKHEGEGGWCNGGPVVVCDAGFRDQRMGETGGKRYLLSLGDQVCKRYPGGGAPGPCSADLPSTVTTCPSPVTEGYCCILSTNPQQPEDFSSGKRMYSAEDSTGPNDCDTLFNPEVPE